jgi:3-oxoacyl-[acyl-carrier-protein] synthase-1
VVVGVDSFHHAETLAAYHARRELVTARNADGFLPGEAAGAVLMTAPAANAGSLRCLGMGWGTEPSDRDRSLPLRADGLAAAVRSALAASRCSYEQLDYRISDLTGGQRAFKEAALVLTRTMRVKKEFFDIWHPADCIGRVGAASLPIMLGVALAAARRGYAPGPGVLCQVGDEDGARAALVLRAADRAPRAA